MILSALVARILIAQGSGYIVEGGFVQGTITPWFIAEAVCVGVLCWGLPSFMNQVAQSCLTATITGTVAWLSIGWVLLPAGWLQLALCVVQWACVGLVCGLVGYGFDQKRLALRKNQ